MKELKIKTGHAEITLDINLEVTYIDEHDEHDTVKDLEAMDFLEKVGFDDIVMSRIWEHIKDGSFWGMFDVEDINGNYVSIDWDINGNLFSVYLEDYSDFAEMSCSELSGEFFDIFGSDIEAIADNPKRRTDLRAYFEEEIDLEYYPGIVYELEKSFGPELIYNH